MAGKKKGGVRAKENKVEIPVSDKTQLSSKLIATEPVIARGRGRPKISQCSHNKAPPCDDQQVDPVIENSKDGESNNSHSQDGEKSVTTIEENVKHFTQILQQEMSTFRVIVAKCDELQNENHELRKKLESSLAKLEEYEKVNLLLSKSIQTFNAWFATSPTISQLGLSPLPSSTDSPKPPESQKPSQIKNTRKATGDGGETPPIATRRKISPGALKKPGFGGICRGRSFGG
ncbi:hypothetical protein FRX31_010796 [Thalictrum thalictroides]|uniref:Uncharacterized protein n=1 Tax=Thalictrum thalictroides TaxID=46969 RepID=A0A7J6WU90_THATH|nr:hypothetical protein FRX31_010796 [Thalictrum thalictroides]